MRTSFHHTGIVVHDLKQVIEKYCIAFGLDGQTIKIHRQFYITGKGEEEEFDYAFIPLGNNTYLELVSPLSDGPTKRYLEKRGEGLFHLAFESDDILTTIEGFEKAGFVLAGRTPSPGDEDLSVFFHPKSTHGVLIQLLKKGVLLPDGSPNLDAVSGKE
ncbi:MAG: VOC family protein [Candidatus Odinarchaeota archaeon]